MESRRNTHFIANQGNHVPNGSREHSCPEPTALAKQTKIGKEQDNCHMATEMGLPQTGNKDIYNTVSLSEVMFRGTWGVVGSPSG